MYFAKNQNHKVGSGSRSGLFWVTRIRIRFLTGSVDPDPEIIYWTATLVCRVEKENLSVVLAWSVGLTNNGKFKCKLAIGIIQVNMRKLAFNSLRIIYFGLWQIIESYSDEVDLILLKKLWKEMIEHQCKKLRSKYKLFKLF